MKKMITLLLAAGFFATSFAQGHREQDSRYSNGQYAINSNNDYYNGNDRKNYDKKNASLMRERDYQIEKINREFTYKIMSVQNNRYMKNRQKKMAIRDLENQRARQIQMVVSRYNSSYKNGYGNYNNGRR